jgi:diguanylate cyclase (GGDEF)-like protein
LLLSHEETRVYGWARALTGAAFRIWQGAAALPPNPRLDIVVTDNPDLCRGVAHPRLQKQLADGRIGRILIGARGSADVRLPADCSDRELGLACRLLGENVALRREFHRSRRMQQMLNRLAYSDPLTGLPNRRAWEDEMLRVASVHAQDVCLALLDLDHLKSVNDRFGHRAGDAVLQAVGAELSRRAVDGDFIARLGGDEFGLLRVHAARENLPAELDAWRTRICQFAPHGPVTASLGYAVAGDLAETTADQLFHEADASLRRAKAAGRDRCEPRATDA